MLSFFEYLRQRVFQAVVAGMEDALAVAEGKSPEGQKAAAEKFLAKFRTGLPSPATCSDAGNGAAATAGAADAIEPENLPPRRRGRPPKN